MRSERKARISGLAGTEHARNRTLPDLAFPVTEWDLGTRLWHWFVALSWLVQRDYFSSFNQSYYRFVASLLHVSHDYFSTFNQWYHWCVALSLPWSFLKIATCHFRWSHLIKRIFHLLISQSRYRLQNTHSWYTQRVIKIRFNVVGSATVAKCNLQDSTSLHDRRFMSQAGWIRYFARSAKRDTRGREN